eukprot:m.106487 g.106487  ORF g.106487 m.106487 type:complete len:60 (+) comp13301_c0_seq2:533-712(+)
MSFQRGGLSVQRGLNQCGSPLATRHAGALTEYLRTAISVQNATLGLRHGGSPGSPATPT